MRSVCSLAFAMVLLVGGAACTTTGKSYIPVDSPLRPWQGPEQSETSVAPAVASPPPSASSPTPPVEKGDKKAKK